MAGASIRGANDPNVSGAEGFVTKLDTVQDAGLTYRSFFGGSGTDAVLDLAVLSDTVYLAGSTTSTSTSFRLRNAYDNTHGGGQDAFVLKIDTTAALTASLNYSRVLGGSGEDAGYGIEINSDGEVFLAGGTHSSNFPTANAFDSQLSGASDGFVARLDSRLRNLLYSTYVGGSKKDWLLGLAQDSSGYTYVVGSSESSDFFTTTTAIQTQKGGNDCGDPPCSDIVIARLDTGVVGSASLQWSSYLGGNSIDHGYGIAVRGTAVYVVGTSFSVNFPTTEGSFEEEADDDPAARDGVIAKIELGLPSPSTVASARYVYDAEGNRVKRTTNGVTTIYVGDLFEREGTSTRKSYYFGGQLVAVRQHGVLSYLLSDHLGSTSVTLDSQGTVLSELRYTPYGRTRTHWGSSTPTDRRFTGQRFEGNVLGGLYDYGARFYDPNVGLFVQPDSIVPDRVRVVAFNRYAYVWNNPLKYSDPTGHSPVSDVTTSLLNSVMSVSIQGWQPPWPNSAAEQQILDATVIIETRYDTVKLDGSPGKATGWSLGTVIADDIVLTHGHYGEDIEDVQSATVIL